jgi:outer membrane protein assembly factor BamB
MNTLEILFVGLKGHVIAFSKSDGTQLWKTELRRGVFVGGDSFVTVLAEGERVYAHTYGQLFCLDAGTGEILWFNELAGLGYDVSMLAVVGISSPSFAALVEHRRQSASESGAATSAAAV